MELLYKPDWEETKQRYISWWQSEYFGRCAISIHARREGAEKVKPPTRPADVIQKWTDLDYIAAEHAYQLEVTYYGGEAFPIWHGLYPGHVSIPAFVGCPLSFEENTCWWGALLEGEALEVSSAQIKPPNKWWQFALELAQLARQKAPGKAVPAIVGALGGCGDTLCALRGAQRLLYDCIEQPQAVLAAEQALMDQWIEVYDMFYSMLCDIAEGSTTWFSLWAPGKFYPTQCDFSYMLSPKMFNELFLPALEKQMHHLDYSVYHCDGVKAFAHLPAICELPKLQAIQILPGAGQPSPLHYIDTLKQVQAAGKNLHITISPDEVPLALSTLSAKGLFIATWTETEQQARDLLKLADELSKP